MWVQDCGQYFPPGLFDDGRPGRGRGTLPVGALHSCFSRLIGPATAASALTPASSPLAQGSDRPIKHASHHTLAGLKPWTGLAGWHALSGKMAVLAAMLEKLKPLGDRIVVVSNSTQVLDLIGALCRECHVSRLPLPHQPCADSV